MSDQLTMQDPTKQYPTPPFKEQSQPEPGLAADMTPKPDHGEQSYRGTGRRQRDRSCSRDRICP